MPYRSELESLGSLFYVTPEGVPAPNVGDGVHYSRALGWQSPEGNFYGQVRFVRDWRVAIMWDGNEYLGMDTAGVAGSYEELPTGPRPHLELWGVPKKNWPPVGVEVYDGRPYDFYFWNSDTEEWQPVVWLYEIDDPDEVPYPGSVVGGAHVVIFPDVEVFWDGYVWRRRRHSSLEDDEPYKHLPEGFIEFLVPDVKLVYFNKRTIGMVPVVGGSGYVLVNGRKVEASQRSLLHASLPSLEIVDNNIIPIPLKLNTEYWIYLVNDNSSSFLISLDDSTVWDFRGRLFCSTAEPVDNKWPHPTLAKNTVLAGKIETNEDVSGPYFRHELDISLISNRPSFGDMFRGYSDFTIQYVSSEEIRLEKTPGTYGQLYIPTEVVYIGNGLSLSIDDCWLFVDADEKPVLMDEPLRPSVRYYIYLINKLDAVNFNEINPSTNRPWSKEDVGAENFYSERLDIRLRLVLCPKSPENYRLTETFPLFYSRCLGHVDIDAAGKIRPSRDMDYAYGWQRNKADLKGLADFAIKPIDESSFSLDRIAGTNGAVYVGNDTIIIPDDNDEDSKFLFIDLDVYRVNKDTGALDFVDKSYNLRNTILYMFRLGFDVGEWGALAGTSIGILEDWYIAPSGNIKILRHDSDEEFLFGFRVGDNGRIQPGETTLHNKDYTNSARVAYDMWGYTQGLTYYQVVSLLTEFDVEYSDYRDDTKFKLSDFLMDYQYDKENPLIELEQVYLYKNATLFVYLANHDKCWGRRAGSVFCTLSPPINGYLSDNYPGNGARWVATIKTDGDGKLTGYWLLDSPGNQDAALLNLNAIASLLHEEDLRLSAYDMYLSAMDNSLWSHASLIDYLLGWGSEFDLGLDSFVDAIWSDVSNLWSDFEDLTQDYSDIMSITDDLCGIADSLTSEVSAVDSLIDDAFSTISNMDSIVTEMGSELSEFDSNLSAVGSIIDMMGSDVSGLISTVDDVQSVLDLTSQEISLLGSDIGDVQSLTSLLDSQLDYMLLLIESAESTNINIQSNINDIISNVDVIDSAVSGLLDVTDSLYSDVSDLESFRDLFTSEVWAILSDAGTLSLITESLNSVLSEIEDINEDLDATLSTISGYESRLDSDYSYILDIYSLMDVNVYNLRQETAILMNLQYWMEIKESCLRSDYFVMSGIQSLMDSNITNLFSDASALDSIADLLSQDITDLFSNISALYGLNDSLGSDLGDLSNELGGLGSDLLSLFSEIDNLSGTTSADMSAIYSWIDVISLDLSDVWDEFDDLNSYTEALSNITDDLWSTANLASGHLSMLDSQIGVLNADILSQSAYASMLDSQLDLMASDLNVQSALIVSLSGVASGITSRVNLQSLYLTSLSLGLDNLDSDLAGHSLWVASLQSLQSGLSGRLNTANSLISDLDRYQDSLFSDINDLDLLTSAFSWKITSLSLNVSNLSNFTSLIDLETDRLSLNALSLSTNISALDNYIDSISNVATGVSNTVVSLNSKLVTLSGRADSLTTYTNSLSVMTSNIDVYAKAVSGRLYSLSNYTIALDSNLDNLEGYYTGLSGNLVNLSGTMNSLSTRTDAIKGLTSALSWGISDLYTAASNLGNHLMNGWSDLSTLSGDVFELDSYLDDFVLRMQSGYIGDVPRIVTFDWIGRRFKFEDQKFAGIPIRVDYEGTNYVSINPLEPNTQIVLPNAGLLNITTETFLDINRSGNLAPGTLYYLYLQQGEGLTSSFSGGWADTSRYFISSTAPSKKYTSMGTSASFTIYDRQNSTYYALGTCIRPPSGTGSEMQAFYFKCVQAGTSGGSYTPSDYNVDVYEKVIDGTCKWECRYDIHDSVCIAYIAVTSTGNMSGTWNLWSVYRQPEQYWETSMTTSNDVSMTMNGFICPVGIQVVMERTGSTVFTIGNVCDFPPVTIGNVSIGPLSWFDSGFGEILCCDMSCGNPLGMAYAYVSNAYTQSSQNIYDMITHTYQIGSFPNWGNPTVKSSTGVSRLTRKTQLFPSII